MKKGVEELYRLEGKTAVVTGAGRGIGRAVADLFAAAGARIVVADILAAEADAAAAAIREDGGEALAVPVDIADEPAVKQLYCQAAQQFSSVDVLIHCAAALEFGAENIRVNAVLPGGTATPGAAEATARMRAAGYELKGPMTHPGRIPLGAMGTAQDIAAACLFLASPAARYITGQCLAVDGGFLIS